MVVNQKSVKHVDTYLLDFLFKVFHFYEDKGMSQRIVSFVPKKGHSIDKSLNTNNKSIPDLEYKCL